MKPNSKSEIRNSKQIPMTKTEENSKRTSRRVSAFWSFVLWILNLFRISNFGFRISALGAVFLLMAGCAAQPEPLRTCPGKATAAEALQTLAARAQRAVPLRADGQAVLTYHVPDRRQPERHNVPLRMWFEPPARTYIQGSIGVDPQAVIMGSNASAFWLALRPKEVSSYYLGQWQEVRDFEGLILSPRVVLEALGIVTDPAGDMNEAPWTLRHQGPYDVLTRRNEAGRLVKRLHIYACDYTVRKIEYFDPRGKVAAVATLGSYEPVVEGFEVPTRIDVVSTRPDGRKDSLVMRIDSLKTMQFNTKQRERYFNPLPAHRYEHVYRLVEGRWVEDGS
jgi:hypothetical protein